MAVNFWTKLLKQTVKIRIRLRSSLIKVYTVCHSIYKALAHARTITVIGKDVQLFSIITIPSFTGSLAKLSKYDEKL